MNKPTTVASTDALFAIASAIGDLALAVEHSGKNIREGLGDVAHQIKFLGNGNAETHGWGAIEGHSKHIGEKLDALVEVIGDCANALREAQAEKEEAWRSPCAVLGGGASAAMG